MHFTLSSSFLSVNIKTCERWCFFLSNFSYMLMLCYSGSPVSRWASVAFGAGVGLGSAYIESSYIFCGSPPKWSSPKVSATSPAPLPTSTPTPVPPLTPAHVRVFDGFVIFVLFVHYILLAFSISRFLLPMVMRK